MTSELPKWPDEAYFQHTGDPEGFLCAKITYWESRCRLAVEALNKISNHMNSRFNVAAVPFGTPTTGTIAIEALAVIGPLPPETPHDPRD